MEVVVKIIITLVVTFGSLKILHWTWTSQIDLKATVEKFINKKPEIAEMVATREPNKIYQNGNPVGDVTGAVRTAEGQVTFAEVVNTSALRYNEPFEYQRMKLRIVKIGNRIGLKFEGPVTKGL